MTRIALIHGTEVIQIWHAPTGEVATRFTLPDGSQISPVALGWRDDEKGYAAVPVVDFVVLEGKQIAGAPSYEIIDGKAVETFQVEDVQPPRRMVRKSVVQARLIEAGKMDAAYVALTANPVYFARWFAPDRPEVFADDPDALLLLAAIGADAETIMAVE